MEPIPVPRGLRDPEPTSYIVQGPFKLTHNGIKSVGMFLLDNGDNYGVYDGSRPWPIDGSYNVQVHSDTITFYSKKWDSKFVVQPLTQADVKWLTPNEPDLDIEGIKELILSGINSEPSRNL